MVLLTAEKRHLGDVPGIGQAADRQAIAVSAWRMVKVEEKGIYVGPRLAHDMAIVRRRLAIDQRRALVSAAVRFEAHLAALLSRAKGDCRVAPRAGQL